MHSPLTRGSIRRAPLVAQVARLQVRAEVGGVQRLARRTPHQLVGLVAVEAQPARRLGRPGGDTGARPLAELAALGRQRAGAGKRRRSRSSHELPLEQTLALAEELRQQPFDGWFLGIGIADCQHGATLSPPVAVALPALAAKLAEILGQLAHPEEALSC